MSAEGKCIYCSGRIVKSRFGAWEPAPSGVDRCTCPNVKKQEAYGGTLVHWAKRRQSVFSMCSDPETHVETAHLVAVERTPLADDARVTCLDCIAIHGD